MIKIIFATAGLAIGIALGVRTARWLISSTPADPGGWTPESFDEETERYRAEGQRRKEERSMAEGDGAVIAIDCRTARCPPRSPPRRTVNARGR